MLLNKLWSKGISYPKVRRGKLPLLLLVTVNVRVKIGGNNARRCHSFKYHPILYNPLSVALNCRLVRRVANVRNSLYVIFLFIVVVIHNVENSKLQNLLFFISSHEYCGNQHRFSNKLLVKFLVRHNTQIRGPAHL